MNNKNKLTDFEKEIADAFTMPPLNADFIVLQQAKKQSRLNKLRASLFSFNLIKSAASILLLLSMAGSVFLFFNVKKTTANSSQTAVLEIDELAEALLEVQDFNDEYILTSMYSELADAVDAQNGIILNS